MRRYRKRYRYDYDNEIYNGLIKLPKSISGTKLGRRSVMVPIGKVDLGELYERINGPQRNIDPIIEQY